MNRKLSASRFCVPPARSRSSPFLKRGVDTCFLGSGLRLEFELESEDHGSIPPKSSSSVGKREGKKPITSPPDMHVLHPVMLRCNGDLVFSIKWRLEMDPGVLPKPSLVRICKIHVTGNA
ncbi:hypothetical protein HL42_4934 [Trichophyton rubrum]|nr:hypothetical protein HL42_4934 [Trichophyton rubrum]